MHRLVLVFATVFASPALIGCVHVPSEVEATFAPIGPGESSNFHKGSHPVPPQSVAAPAPVPVPAPTPAPTTVPDSPDTQKAKGGEA